MFTEAQLRELVDEDARENGGNFVLAAKLNLNERTIRRLRNLISVSSGTLLTLDLHYQQRPELLERLRFRLAYDRRKREGAPTFSLTMPAAGGQWLIRRRTPKT
jgi:hypothetical protein